MKLSRFPSASAEELAKLKQLVKKVPNAPRILGTAKVASPDVPPPAPPTPGPQPEKVTPKAERQKYYKELFNGGIANVEVTREALAIDNPVILLNLLMPEIRIYKWQFEQLMMIAGYLTPGDYKNKTIITDKEAFKPILSAANGSGKDMIIIAAGAVWFALTGVRNRCIVTSSSFDQTKFQTEVHIRELVNRANKKFGTLFRGTQFHYVVPELGSEIKLFATDEPGRAEGYHPFPGGRMMLIMNEAKSIKETLFDALSRCTGYSHWIEISSPGPRRGHMYRASEQAVHYPAKAVLGKFYFRRITAYDCPHIPISHIQAMAYEKGENSPWFRSSILAEFSDYDEPVAITEYAWTRCFDHPPIEQGKDIGIGLDLAAGGDENACFVRQGNKVIHSFFFRQEDTELAAASIDMQLSQFKDIDYVFRADDGGVGHAIIDKLVTKNWRIRRTNNQSPAFNKREFLNLGAEMYFHVKRLIERVDIILPKIDKLKLQLTTRRHKGEESTQGKFALESKSEARSCGMTSPDRADAFVLCFSTFRTNRVEIKKDLGPRSYTIKQLLDLERRGLLNTKHTPPTLGRFTSILKV